MRLLCLTRVNRRLYPAIADNIVGRVDAGQEIEVSATTLDASGYTWRNILNTPYWVAETKIGASTPYFERLTDIPDPNPNPIPNPDPIPPDDCRLALQLEGFSLTDANGQEWGIIHDSQSVVIDEWGHELKILGIDDKTHYHFLIAGQGFSELTIEVV